MFSYFQGSLSCIDWKHWVSFPVNWVLQMVLDERLCWDAVWKAVPGEERLRLCQSRVTVVYLGLSLEPISFRPVDFRPWGIAGVCQVQLLCCFCAASLQASSAFFKTLIQKYFKYVFSPFPPQLKSDQPEVCQLWTSLLKPELDLSWSFPTAAWWCFSAMSCSQSKFSILAPIELFPFCHKILKVRKWVFVFGCPDQNHLKRIQVLGSSEACVGL